MDVKPKNGDVTDDNIDISSLPEKARKLLSELEDIQVCSSCETEVSCQDKICSYCGEKLN